MTIGRVWFAAGVTQDLEIVAFESAEAFQAWLGENHAASSGIWLKLRKKGPGIVALDYAQALDVALCYGWIDGQKAKFDDQWWLQRFTPRKPRSKWSKVNRDKVAALIEQGRMGLIRFDGHSRSGASASGGCPSWRAWGRRSLAALAVRSRRSSRPRSSG
ncbi:YdeI family protein, partial [Streptomyces sp. NPDC058239]|uniref:YdeI/OmpD-associated family protein n=1 Tax=Streptomyces sp. NPDC058239 TaxID=3346395 RepID=UPI0036E1A8E5